LGPAAAAAARHQHGAPAVLKARFGLERALRWSVAAAILLCAGAARLTDLGDDGLDLFELRAVGLASTSGESIAAELRNQPATTPLHAVVLRAAALYGLREETLRLPSAILGIVALAAAMLFVRDLFGPRAALVTGILLAFSPFPLQLSREATAPSLSAATAAVLAWLLWRLLRSERGFPWAALAGAIALYASYAALAVLAAACVTAAVGFAAGELSRRAALRVAGATLLACLLFVPWAVYDLPTEPGREFAAINAGREIALALLQMPLFGASAPSTPSAYGLSGTLLLAALFAPFALRRRRLESLFAWAAIIFAVAGTVTTAYAGPYVFQPAQLLFALPFYFGLTGAALAWCTRRLPLSARTLACAGVAVVLAFAVERPAAETPVPGRENWRDAIGVVRRNLGRDDTVAIPEAREAVQFYGVDLQRRMPLKDRLPFAYSWVTRPWRSWFIAGWRVRLNPDWPPLMAKLRRARFVVDLSPADEPKVYFSGPERKPTYLAACHMDLPAAVIARQTILRDCLVEVGALDGPLRQVRTLSSARVSMRNPALLESVQLLADAGKTDEARALAEAIAAQEPDLMLAAREAMQPSAPK